VSTQLWVEAMTLSVKGGGVQAPLSKMSDVAILFRTHGDMDTTQQTRCVR
jgi:hypothetical protein